jgi:hypothetical protein
MTLITLGIKNSSVINDKKFKEFFGLIRELKI